MIAVADPRDSRVDEPLSELADCRSQIEDLDLRLVITFGFERAHALGHAVAVTPWSDTATDHDREGTSVHHSYRLAVCIAETRAD